MYIKIGSEVKDILSFCELPYEEKERLLLHSLSSEEVKRVADYKTTLEKMQKKDFELISRHGYELADCLIKCFG